MSPAPLILVVEDHDALRAAISRMLRRQGYEVVIAADPADAIRLILADSLPIDLAIVDMMLPDPGSPAVLDALQSRMAPLRVILTSGYDPAAIRFLPAFEALAGASDFRFLAKPFGYDELVGVVAEVVDGSDDRVRVVTTGEWRLPES